MNSVCGYILLVTAWVAWCALHSALINNTVTEFLGRRFPGAYRYHRVSFNLVAIATLVPVVVYGASMRSDPVVTWMGAWRIVPVVLWVAALVYFMAGARRYDFLQFAGLRQIRSENSCSALTDDCSLDTRGVLAVVRHPWYAGGILVVWGRPLDTAAILTNLVLCGYFVVGAMLEERKLTRQFGRQYTDYRQKVSMFFPIKWATRFLTR